MPDSKGRNQEIVSSTEKPDDRAASDLYEEPTDLGLTAYGYFLDGVRLPFYILGGIGEVLWFLGREPDYSRSPTRSQGFLSSSL